MKNLIQSTTNLAAYIAGAYIRPGATVIDATCGNGHDTLALAKAMHLDCENHINCKSRPGRTGRLYAFDIQQRAIDATRDLLEKEGFGPQISSGSIRLINDSHENIIRHLAEADLVVFNLGYLPGGDKSVTTSVGSTLSAVSSALDMLATGGLVSIAMYSGHAEGAKEKAGLLAFAGKLDSKKYHVAYIGMINQPENPPELLLITRKR